MIPRSLKRIAFLFLFVVMTAAGCATLDPPHYIQAENPYKRTYYGEFAQVLDAVRSSLNDAGWQVVKEVDPDLYERNPLHEAGDKDNVLLFTQMRKAQRVIYAKSTHLNVYVSRVDNGVEVDVRYGAVRNFHAFKTRSYRNDPMIKKILDHIEQKLLTKN